MYGLKFQFQYKFLVENLKTLTRNYNLLFPNNIEAFATISDDYKLFGQRVPERT